MRRSIMSWPLPRRPTLAVRASVVLVALLGAGTLRAQTAYLDTMRFAADMAKRGNWREAKFRWDQVVREEPHNPKVLNNLAVALEALGEPGAARATYDRALGVAGDNPVVVANRQRAERFWGQVEREGDAEPPTYDVNGLIPGEAEGLAPGKKQKDKSFKVAVTLPVPARLDLGDRRTVLVASFITDESELLDVNRELVRFVRAELRKHSGLELLPVVPPPAVPEQTLEDMIANAEFWKYLGQEFAADLIVSGIMRYDRRDSSGFRDVDVISPTTGQKVRQSQFVEQERFSYELDLVFMDGRTGELLFRDRLQRSAVFRGTQNDPINAFYELSESIAPDLLAIVRPRTREDIRFVFKR
jgi:hypothetical protein